MSNLIDIQSQIEKLQKQAGEIKAREFDKTVEEIRAKMLAFGITIKDLQAPAKTRKGRGRPPASPKVPSKTAVSAKSKKVRSPVAAKFMGPNGETWTGRGLMPNWLKSLIAQGHAKETYAVQA